MQFRAKISMLPTAEGGRKTSVTSGYRPQFFFAQADWECTHIDFGDGTEVKPGEAADATITLSDHASGKLAGKLHLGARFELREGAKTVARGSITRLAGGADPLNR